MSSSKSAEAYLIIKQQIRYPDAAYVQQKDSGFFMPLSAVSPYRQRISGLLTFTQLGIYGVDTRLASLLDHLHDALSGLFLLYLLAYEAPEEVL